LGKVFETGQISKRQMLDIPPVWLVGALLLVWAQARFMPDLTFASGILRLVAVGLAISGVLLAIWAFAAFRKHQTSVVPHQVPDTLITSGPFRVSRNPIYLADVMVLIAAVLWLGAWPSLLIVGVFVSLIQQRFIFVEEARLRLHFQDAFSLYAGSVRRWI
jgi:protein-S-isoprenylcysteine O-methyltransferase Ste14